MSDEKRLHQLKLQLKSSHTFQDMVKNTENRNHGGVVIKMQKLDTNNPNEKLHYNLIQYSDTSMKPKDKHSNLVIVHGATEHSGRYNFLAHMFAMEGFIVHSFDFRGMGQSDGPLQDAENVEHFHYCIGLCLKQIKKFELPIYIQAHSMGGGFVTSFQLKNPSLLTDNLINGVILSGPLTGFEDAESGMYDETALQKFQIGYLQFRNYKWKTPLSCWPGRLAKNSAVAEKLWEDPLIGKGSTTDQIYVMLKNAFMIQGLKKVVLQCPLLLLMGKNDALVPVKFNESFFEKLESPNKKKVMYQESLHEIFDDHEGVNAFDEMFRFIEEIKLENKPKKQGIKSFNEFDFQYGDFRPYWEQPFTLKGILVVQLALIIILILVFKFVF